MHYLIPCRQSTWTTNVNGQSLDKRPTTDPKYLIFCKRNLTCPPYLRSQDCATAMIVTGLRPCARGFNPFALPQLDPPSFKARGETGPLSPARILKVCVVDQSSCDNAAVPCVSRLNAWERLFPKHDVAPPLFQPAKAHRPNLLYSA